MKKLLTVFAVLLLFRVTTAQDKKPTKEETINYIKNTLNQKDPIYRLVIAEKSGNGVLRPEITTEVFLRSILLSECELIMTLDEKTSKVYSDSKWKEYNKNFDSSEEVKIPLDKIENIKNATIPSIEYGVDEDHIKFYTSNGFKSIFVNNNELSEYSLKIKNIDIEKLTKAFNHLRKLCGAPEPISFD